MVDQNAYYERAFTDVLERDSLLERIGIPVLLDADTPPLYCHPFVLFRFDCLKVESLKVNDEPKARQLTHDGLKPLLDLSAHGERAVVEMLRFVYLGVLKLETDVELADEVVAIGTQLDFEALLRQCAKWLDSVSVEDLVTAEAVFYLSVATRAEASLKRCAGLLLSDGEAVMKLAREWIDQGQIEFLAALFKHTDGYADTYQVSMFHLNKSFPNVSFAFTANDDQIAKVLSGERTRHSDIEVVVNYDDSVPFTYHCHKTILANCSVLLAMTESQFADAREDRIYVREIPREAMDEVLRYIYGRKTGNLAVRPPTWEGTHCLAEMVIKKADQYDLPELQHWCCLALANTALQHQNLFRLLGLGRLYNIDPLIKRCFSHLNANRGEVLSTPEFSDAVRTDRDSILLLLQAAVNYKAARKWCPPAASSPSVAARRMVASGVARKAADEYAMYAARGKNVKNVDRPIIRATRRSGTS